LLGTVLTISSPTVNKLQTPTNASRTADAKPRIIEHMEARRTPD
jgi:hypothetical protein